MEKDCLSMSGRFMLYEDGVLVIDEPNLVTNIGAELWARLMFGDITDVPSYLSVDGTEIVYDVTSSIANEILLQEERDKVIDGNKITYEFLISGDEAIGQIYGFGITNVPDGATNFGKVNTNLINQNYIHAQDKFLRIIWVLEVVV